MPGRQTALRCAWALALGASLATPAAPQTRSAFDGTWTVVFSCPGARDGTSGYTRRFLATVQGGVLHGEIGVQGQSSFLALDGPIGMDGSAMLTGRGLTGQANYAVGRPSPGTPYTFRLQSRFSPTNGTGTRIEVRQCDAVFTRN